jgi:hypothetical protein
MFWRRKRTPPLQATYEGIGGEVGVEEILVQAAQAIDIAGMLAARTGDAEHLLLVSEGWTKLADFIVALGDHDDKKNNLDKKSGFPTGFQSSKDDDARD